MKIKKKIKKKSGSKTEILRNTEAQPKQLVSYKKKKSVTEIYQNHHCLVADFLKGMPYKLLKHIVNVMDNAILNQ